MYEDLGFGQALDGDLAGSAHLREQFIVTGNPQFKAQYVVAADRDQDQLMQKLTAFHTLPPGPAIRDQVDLLGATIKSFSGTSEAFKCVLRQAAISTAKASACDALTLRRLVEQDAAAPVAGAVPLSLTSGLASARAAALASVEDAMTRSACPATNSLQARIIAAADSDGIMTASSRLFQRLDSQILRLSVLLRSMLVSDMHSFAAGAAYRAACLERIRTTPASSPAPDILDATLIVDAIAAAKAKPKAVSRTGSSKRSFEGNGGGSGHSKRNKGGRGGGGRGGGGNGNGASTAGGRNNKKDDG